MSTVRIACLLGLLTLVDLIAGLGAALLLLWATAVDSAWFPAAMALAPLAAWTGLALSSRVGASLRNRWLASCFDDDFASYVEEMISSDLGVGEQLRPVELMDWAPHARARPAFTLLINESAVQTAAHSAIHLHGALRIDRKSHFKRAA